MIFRQCKTSGWRSPNTHVVKTPRFSKAKTPSFTIFKFAYKKSSHASGDVAHNPVRYVACDTHMSSAHPQSGVLYEVHAPFVDRGPGVRLRQLHRTEPARRHSRSAGLGCNCESRGRSAARPARWPAAGSRPAQVLAPAQADVHRHDRPVGWLP